MANKINIKGSAVVEILQNRGLTASEVGIELGYGRGYISYCLASGSMAAPAFYALCIYLGIPRELLESTRPEPCQLRPRKVEDDELKKREPITNVKRIRNLTGHELNFMNQFGETIKTLPSDGFVRSYTPHQITHYINGIPVLESSPTETNLPEKEEGTYLIVSLRVALDAGLRDDLLVVTENKRDSTGRVVGCRGVIRP